MTLASIAGTNARVLSAPFLLAFFRFPAHRRSRQLGDLLIAGLLGANALRVGLALGRWHARLLPYVPQLPLEWLAAALAAAAWLTLRTGARTQTALAYLAAVLVVVVAAAAVETIATPHARAREPNVTVEFGRPRRFIHLAQPLSGRPGVDCLRSDRAPAPALASRSLRSLPLAVARFRSAVWPALPGYVNHPRIPQRRDHSERSAPDRPAHPGRRPRASAASTKVAQLRLAVPRGRDKNGEDRGADFVDVVCFGRQAEVCAELPRQGPADRRRGSPAPRRVGRRERPPPEARGDRAERRVPRRPRTEQRAPEQAEPVAA